MDYNQEALKVHEQYKGKLRVECPAPLKTRDDLSVAYTPAWRSPAAKSRPTRRRYTAIPPKGTWWRW